MRIWHPRTPMQALIAVPVLIAGTCAATVLGLAAAGIWGGLIAGIGSILLIRAILK